MREADLGIDNSVLALIVKNIEPSFESAGNDCNLYETDYVIETLEMTAGDTADSDLKQKITGAIDRLKQLAPTLSYLTINR